MDLKAKLVELLSQYFDIGDSYAYNLTRVKTAFGVGTMSLDDFEEFDDEVVADIADHLIANGVTVQEWIPVTEPPTKQGWYHVAIKDLKTGKYRVENDLYAIETAIAHGHSVGFCKEKAWPERDKLTHWCYYPEPPKGD